VHSGNGWLFASPNGGWEYPLYLFVLCIAQAMLGDGAYALSQSWWPRARELASDLFGQHGPLCNVGVASAAPMLRSTELSVIVASRDGGLHWLSMKV
jgi:hypothetical protein